MVAADEAALICDFAETYHLYDYRELPARRAALLACGLRPESRIVQKISGAKAPTETMLLALIADALKILVWQNTRDGTKGRNKPTSIVEAILGEEKETAEGFDSAAEFEAWRASMLGGENNAC